MTSKLKWLEQFADVLQHKPGLTSLTEHYWHWCSSPCAAATLPSSPLRLLWRYKVGAHLFISVTLPLPLVKSTLLTASMVKSATRPRSRVTTVFTCRVHEKWESKLTMRSHNTSFIQTTRSLLLLKKERKLLWQRSTLSALPLLKHTTIAIQKGEK